MNIYHKKCDWISHSTGFWMSIYPASESYKSLLFDRHDQKNNNVKLKIAKLSKCAYFYMNESLSRNCFLSKYFIRFAGLKMNPDWYFVSSGITRSQWLRLHMKYEHNEIWTYDNYNNTGETYCTA